jgi:transcriptional regulator with XRE-family HTH domain
MGGLASGLMAMSTLRHRLGKAVRRLRSSSGYSQESFADHAKVHRTYMGTVERGEVNLTLENIEKIAKALGLAASELLRAAENEK